MSFRRCSVLFCTLSCSYQKEKRKNRETEKINAVSQIGDFLKWKSTFTILGLLVVSVHEAEKEALLLPMLPASGEALILFMDLFIVLKLPAR